MRKHLYVGGADLANYGVYVSGEGTFGAPEKEVTTYAVPGRNGLVLGVNERMENIQVTYPCFIYTNFEQNMRDLRSFLLSRSGYVKINDDYDTTHFRMGFFEAGIDPNVVPKNNAARFDLTFNCQPQRWLTSGETVITITSHSMESITNATRFPAAPLFQVFGTGQITVQPAGSSFRYIKISSDITTDIPTYTSLYIDAETNDIYGVGGYASQNLAKYVSIENAGGTTGLDVPKLNPGINSVQLGATITKLEITPRWWEA